MSVNLWFKYGFPLAIAVFLLFGGWWAFRHFARGHRDSRGRKYGEKEGCTGVSMMVLGGTLALAILFTSPTPWERKRIFNGIFRTPPDQIKRFVIRPGDANQHRPLAKSELIVDDPARIQQIAMILRAATELSPNHPRARWKARVEMVTNDGSFHFGVYATVAGDPNGTFVNVSSKPAGGGWNLGDLRADGLDVILEEAANTAGAR